MLTRDNQYKIPENIPSKDKSAFSYTKYQNFLREDAPTVSNLCCTVMKKEPAHRYAKQTGRHPITAEMASESRLRAQKWLQNGCNGFQMKAPKSTPMAFWFEQDVLQYIYDNNLPIASVYGDIVKENEIDGQLDFADLGIFDLGRPTLKTTGCNRTGCVFCGYGAHLDVEGQERFLRLKNTHPQLYDYIMRPWDEGGLDFKTVIDWINNNINVNIKY